MRAYFILALAVMIPACDDDDATGVETWVQLGEVADVTLGPVNGRVIDLAITTVGDGCLVGGPTEFSTEDMIIDIMPLDTIRSVGGVCTSIRNSYVHEISVEVSKPGNYTAIIHGRDFSGAETTTTISDITVR